MLHLSFRQTNSETMVRAAATVLFSALARQKTPEVNIAEVAEHPQYGFTASAVAEPIGPRLVRITDLQDSRIVWESVPYCECPNPEKYLLRENDILFARTGATTGKTHLVRSPELAVFASYLIRLRPKANVEAGYLYSFFQSDNYWSQISHEKEGSAQPNVNGEKLVGLKIPAVQPEMQRAIAEFLVCVRRRQDGDPIELPELPRPLAEQRRIVVRIEELAAEIERARDLRQEATEQAEALLLSVLHRHFVVESATWTPLPMEQAIEITDKQVDPTLPEYSQLPHISGENMESKTCRLLPWRTAEVDGVKSNNYLFAPETILYSKIRPYLRKAVFVDFQGVSSAEVYPIRVSSPKLDPHFVKWTLVAEPFTNYANRLSGRTRMPKLNRKQLFRFDFTHPPLSEQRRIVSELDRLQAQVDALKALQAETSAELDALKPSILDKAFRGEL
jgi:type I restriction enzyme S subunit